MPIGYVNTDHSAHVIYELDVSFTYRRGVVVARSDSNGQSYGLETWSEQLTSLHAFFVSWGIALINYSGTLFGDEV